MTSDAKPRPSRRVRTESSPFHWAPSRSRNGPHVDRAGRRRRVPGRLVNFEPTCISLERRAPKSLHLGAGPELPPPALRLGGPVGEVLARVLLTERGVAFLLHLVDERLRHLASGRRPITVVG
jgi:hypothetical protein